ncbi:MAG TPA: hypothetical protein VN775_04685 [Opitutaceae bacterium]|nr:hypothetical protein [Opitutaceae bacterium]
MKGNIILGAIGLALGMSCGGRLWAKSDATLDDTLKWIEKHRADFQAEWHTADAPTRWQPEDFKNFSESRDLYWVRTITWTGRSECPHFNKALEADGESYSITSAISFVGNVTDKGEKEATKDKSFTRQVSASYTWRMKISQISPESVVMDYRDYLKLTNQTDNPSVDLGTYYYVCILPRKDAEKDAIVEIFNDQRTDDGQGIVSMVKGHAEAATMAGIAAVHDRKMAERLANAVGHLIGLLQAQSLKQPKEAF